MLISSYTSLTHNKLLIKLLHCKQAAAVSTASEAPAAVHTQQNNSTKKGPSIVAISRVVFQWNSTSAAVVQTFGCFKSFRLFWLDSAESVTTYLRDKVTIRIIKYTVTLASVSNALERCLDAINLVLLSSLTRFYLLLFIYASSVTTSSCVPNVQHSRFCEIQSLLYVRYVTIAR